MEEGQTDPWHRRGADSEGTVLPSTVTEPPQCARGFTDPLNTSTRGCHCPSRELPSHMPCVRPCPTPTVTGNINPRVLHVPWECFSAEPEQDSTALRSAGPSSMPFITKHPGAAGSSVPDAGTLRHHYGPVPSEEDDKQTHSVDLTLPGFETTPGHMARVTQSPNTHAPPLPTASACPTGQAWGRSHLVASPPSPVPSCVPTGTLPHQAGWCWN